MLHSCPECGKSCNVLDLPEADCFHCACTSTCHFGLAAHPDDLLQGSSTSTGSPSPNQDAARTCPMCGAVNPAVQRECTACGESFTQGPGAGDLFRERQLLVIRKGATLPPRCLFTNRPSEDILKRELTWHPRWLYVVAFIPGPLFYILAAVIVRQKARLELPFTYEALQRRRLVLLRGWIGGLTGVALWLSVPILAVVNNWGDMLAATGASTGLGLIMISWFLTSRYSSIVVPTRITKKFVWLRGVHPDYLADLPDFPGENVA